MRCRDQDAIVKENADRSAGEQMRVRIGIHVGDIVVQGDNLFGDAVKYRGSVGGLRSRAGFVSRVLFGTTSGRSCLSASSISASSRGKKYRSTDQGISDRKRDRAAIPVGGSSLPLPDQPSIAVLPFQNMSGDPEQEYFADGMVEAVTGKIDRGNQPLIFSGGWCLCNLETVFLCVL